MTATTDFVAAQRVNRRNTFLLLAILTLLAAATGYVVGWLLEGEMSDSVPLFSQAGLVPAGLMAGLRFGRGGGCPPPGGWLTFRLLYAAGTSPTRRTGPAWPGAGPLQRGLPAPGRWRPRRCCAPGRPW